MVVLDVNFALGCGPGMDYSYIYIYIYIYLFIYLFKCTLERTDDITNEVLEIFEVQVTVNRDKFL